MSTSVALMVMFTWEMVMSQADQTVVVRTMYGDIRGLRTSTSTDLYMDTFLNIPYAKAPLGQLRFRAPEPPVRWRGVRDGTMVGPQCPQRYVSLAGYHFTQSENCLVLNVYTPQPAVNASGPLPVMLWVHGGSYMFGSANRYDGTMLATKEVVVVTVNYRLDVLGFLSTEDEAAMGNYGLLDLIRALEWVRDVISVFNGDPDNVTLFGQSAGSGLVSLLLMTKRAEGLLHKAIMESGVSLSPWAVSLAGSAVKPVPLLQAQRVARILQCRTDNTTIMVDCMRTRNPWITVNSMVFYEITDSVTSLPFRPVVTIGRTDGLFDLTPEAYLTSGHFAKVPTIRGYNKNDWTGIIGQWLDPTAPHDENTYLRVFQLNLQKFLQDFALAQPAFHGDLQTTVDRFMQTYVYTPGIKDHLELLRALVQIGTDVMFASPAIEETRMSSRKTSQPQYFYRFSYRPQNSEMPDWEGVSHGDEMALVFGFPFMDNITWPEFNITWTDEDRSFSDDVMTMWTNFAKYGDPTPSPINGTYWSPWTEATPTYLDIDSPFRMLSGPHRPALSFPHSLLSTGHTEPLVG